MQRALAVVVFLTLGGSAYAAVDPQLVALDAQAHALHKGALRTGEPIRGSAPQMDWSAPLTPGACYVVAARVTMSAKTIAVTIFSPDGKRVAAAKPALATTLHYCATWLGDYHMQARANGAGTYLVGTYMVSSVSGVPIVAPPPPLVAAPTPVVPAPVAPRPTVVYQPVYIPMPVVQPATAYVYGAAPAATSTPIYSNAPSSGAQHHGSLIVTPVVGTKGGDCKSSLDCGPGEFCKEDSYGIKACMGESHKGMPCSSSIDCGSGMFCTEIDGDASYKVCQ